MSKLSKTLGVTMEELLQLEQGKDTDGEGKPKDKGYLEAELPPSLKHSLDEYIEGEKNQVLYLDCLWGELYGFINACQWDGRITKEQADYLRGNIYRKGEQMERVDFTFCEVNKFKAYGEQTEIKLIFVTSKRAIW